MIRTVRLEDLDDVINIERASFPVAWEYSIFLNICLQGGQVVSGESKTLFMDVIGDDDKVIGYAVWETDSYKNEGHILNLAVQADMRKRGIGTRLLSHVLDHMRTNNMYSCHLEVRETNLPAKKLYESNGFVASSKIPGYYFDEDAIVYSLVL